MMYIFLLGFLSLPVLEPHNSVDVRQSFIAIQAKNVNLQDTENGGVELVNEGT